MSASRLSSWKELLADPARDEHIAQLYQDEDFYGEAVSHFAAEGVARGESIVIAATAANWAKISARLTRKGLALADLFRRGQLTLLDAEQTLPRFLTSDMPDGKIFTDFAHATIEKARAGGKFTRVRWWGDMVNLLYVNGNVRGAIRFEEFLDDVAREQSVAILCSFLMDKYDSKIYDRAFGEVCRTHTHIVPAEDYRCHREAVDHAVAKILGDVKGALLKSLVSWKQDMISGMPASQTILLWVKDTVPDKFGQVLACARARERQIVRGTGHA